MIRRTLSQLDLSRQSDDDDMMIFSQNEPVYEDSRTADSQIFLDSQPIEICSRAIESKEIMHELNRLEGSFEENFTDVTKVIDRLSEQLQKASRKRRSPEEIAIPKMLKKVCEDNQRLVKLHEQLLAASHDISKIMEIRLHRIEAVVDEALPKKRRLRNT